MVGQVNAQRYAELVAEARNLVGVVSRAQFRIGECALEIEPLRPTGGAHPGPGEQLFSVAESLAQFADDIGLSVRTVEKHRTVAARWPEEHRREGVSYEVHRVLSAIEVDKDRWAMIKRPPLDERTGTRRWTADAAKRLVGWQVGRPKTVQEKVEAIHDLASSDEVAAVVTTDFLRRPEVASRTMADTTARHAVNRAQVDHSRQAAHVVRQRTPELRRLEHTAGFMELVGACTAFVATIGRAVPASRGQRFTEDEAATVHKGAARVRAAVDWLESAVDTGNTSLDQGLAKLLRGE
ncbi:DUF6192 family protein [Lentzea guizhouensis]|nr:DUF6192 family protein [Lentzea guizhouensis]